MRNLKKFLAVIVVVTMILSTMMVSVFADDSATTTDNSTTTVDNSANTVDNSTTTDSAVNADNSSDDETPVVEKSAGEICADLGILKGGANGKVDEEYLSTSTQRIQAAIIYLRLLGLEEEARAFDGTENFADASKVADASAVKLMAYLKANPDLGWVGDGKNFNPTEQVSAQQFYKVLLTTLGYTQGEDFEYSETIAFAKFSGLSKIASVNKLTNADMATALTEALASSFKGGGPSDTLISKLVNDGIIDAAKAIAAGFEVNTNDVVSVVAPEAIDVVFGTATPELPATVVGKLSDGSSVDCDVTWDLAGAKYDGNTVGKYTISGTVEGFADGVTIDVNVKALVLDVVSVDVPNLRQMVITFNGAVSGDAVKTAANYAIKDKAPDNVALSDDGKVVTLTTSVANAMINYSTDNKLLIKKDIGNGLAADKTIENIAAKDTTVPTIVSATPTGPRSLNVVFSEPVTGAGIVGAFSMDDGKIGLDSINVSMNATDTQVTLNTLADMVEGAHTIKISGTIVKDSAGYPVAGNTLSYNYVKDTSPLTATVSEVKEKTVKIKFNKAIKLNTFKGNAAVKLSHTYSGQNEVTGAAVDTSDNQEFTITFVNPLAPGTSTVWLNYVDNTSDSNKIQDGYGNIFAATTFSVTCNADTVAPTVAAEFVNAAQLKVTYNENVNIADATNKDNYTLKDSSGNVITIDNVARQDGTSNTVFLVNTAANAINGGNVTLTIKNVKDVSVAANKLADTTLTVACTDKVAPDLDGTTPFVQISLTKIKINFTEAIDSTVLLDKNNYFIGGVALTADDTLTSLNNGKSVLITLKTAKAAGVNVVVGRLKDTAGNVSGWLSQLAGTTITSGFATIGYKSAEMIGGNKIKLTIEDQLSSTGTTADYVYKVGSSDWLPVNGIASFSVDTANNKTYIELIIGYDAGDDTDLTAPVYIATTGGGFVGSASPNIKNGQDQLLAVTTAAIATDKLAPKYLSVATGAAINDAKPKLHTVVLTFSEALYVPSVSDSDFTVDGFTVSGVEVTGNVVTITLADKDNSVNEKPKVTLTGSVEDTARNVLTGPVDKTCP